MKLLLILATVALLIWLLRGGRRKTVSRAAPPRASATREVAGPEPMVRCAACGLHLPATDALPGPSGTMYCCADHRRSAS